MKRVSTSYATGVSLLLGQVSPERSFSHLRQTCELGKSVDTGELGQARRETAVVGRDDVDHADNTGHDLLSVSVLNLPAVLLFTHSPTD